MVTFGGSGSLLACRLVDILGLDGVLVPLNPGNLSAYGLLTVDVRNDYVQTAVAQRRRARRRPRPGGVRRAGRPGRRGARARGVRGAGAGVRAHRGPALLRAGLRGARRRARRTGRPTSSSPRSPSAFHDEHRALYGYDFRDDPRQEVEWVNLRVTGVGPIRKPSLREVAPGTGADAARTGTRQVFFDDWVEATVYDRARLGAGDVVEGPAVLEEFSSTVPLHPGFTAAVDSFGNLVIRRSAS